MFGDKVARRDARRYRKKGLDRTARKMVDFLVARHVDGLTVLEVGGGVGAIGLELVKAGADHAVNLELSPAYDGPARELAREAGLEGRTELRLVDLAAEPAGAEAADVVVLHRVVCCYPDADRLVAAAAEHARGALVLSYPPRAWWTLAFAAVLNTVMRLARREYRSYMHPPRAFLGEAERRGLRRALAATSWPWRIAGLERVASVA